MTVEPIIIAAAAEYLLFGLIFWTDPNYFWNPGDGLLKAISCVRKTELEEDGSNHLDPMHRILTYGKGAGILPMAAMMLMAAREGGKGEVMAKKDACRTGFYFSLLMFLLEFDAVIRADNEHLNLPMVGFY